MYAGMKLVRYNTLSTHTQQPIDTPVHTPCQAARKKAEAQRAKAVAAAKAHPFKPDLGNSAASAARKAVDARLADGPQAYGMCTAPLYPRQSC